jgi:hypothetical protein
LSRSLYIGGEMPRDVLHFFVNLVEVIAAIAGVLIAGLLVTMAGLRLLPRIFGVTAEPLEDSDLDEEDLPPHPDPHPEDAAVDKGNG